MKFILGKKIEMTQIWKGDNVIAVTKVQAGPCQVLQIKNVKKDGYESIQIGFDSKKEKNINKPQIGHFKKAGARTDTRFVKEFRTNDKAEVGDLITVATFNEGDKVKIVGTSKGKGFQGVVRRHGFHGQDKTHGHKDQNRMPGSIGATAPQRVFKGLRMGGHMGDDRTTIPNTEIVEIDLANNILYIKGGLPGGRNSLVMIQGGGDLVVNKKGEEKTEVAVNETTKEEVATEEVVASEENKAE